jgi:Putative bacterial sensory transduction regulator
LRFLRHAVLFPLEGPADQILVIRARPHATVPPDWADRAYRVVNEWNHLRRFMKAYIGDPTDSGQLPIYAEIQMPLPRACTTHCWSRWSTARRLSRPGSRADCTTTAGCCGVLPDCKNDLGLPG